MFLDKILLWRSYPYKKLCYVNKNFLLFHKMWKKEPRHSLVISYLLCVSPDLSSTIQKNKKKKYLPSIYKKKNLKSFFLYKMLLRLLVVWGFNHHYWMQSWLNMILMHMSKWLLTSPKRSVFWSLFNKFFFCVLFYLVSASIYPLLIDCFWCL